MTSKTVASRWTGVASGRIGAEIATPRAVLGNTGTEGPRLTLFTEGGLAMSLPAVTHTVCSLPDCDRPYKERGLCNMHRMQQRRAGTLTAITKPRGITKGRKLGPYTTTEGRLEDLRWMLDTGESPLMACRRLGITAHALARWLTRHQQHELARIFYGLDKQREPVH